MRILRKARAVAEWSRRLRHEGVTIGFVPTMGALHAGHRALIREARLSCDALAVSVFVNPLQFGPGEDFERYPRAFRADAAACREEGADVVFAPPVEALYPPGFATTVSVRGLSVRWEGERRPGHFDGVATVVTKLLGLVRPDVVFLGQKDYQQVVLIRRLVEDLDLGARIVVRPTLREADGLALSSRNAYLSPAQRRAAPVLYRALLAGRDAVRRGERSPATVGRLMGAIVSTQRVARVDYLAVCDPETLEPVRRVAGTVVLLGAVKVGHVRLIDNMLVKTR